MSKECMTYQVHQRKFKPKLNYLAQSSDGNPYAHQVVNMFWNWSKEICHRTSSEDWLLERMKTFNRHDTLDVNTSPRRMCRPNGGDELIVPESRNAHTPMMCVVVYHVHLVATYHKPGCATVPTTPHLDRTAPPMAKPCAATGLPCSTMATSWATLLVLALATTPLICPDRSSRGRLH